MSQHSEPLPRTKRRVVDLARRQGILRARDLDQLRISREYLSRLRKDGVLTQVARGLYVLHDASPTEQRTLAQVARVLPNSVVCLLSALQLHGLTTQLPHQVWMAILPSARKPARKDLPLHIVRMTDLSTGREERVVEKVPVHVFSAARTVVDCFRYRNKLGLDVALEALRDFQGARGDMDEVWRIAKKLRAARMMRPYLEALA
jgi:predicted transcriptional regulator of viral defense system